jgi:hypothetical protein
MNGVVFQISANEMTVIEDQNPPNQSVVSLMPGSQLSHWLTNPVSRENATARRTPRPR